MLAIVAGVSTRAMALLLCITVGACTTTTWMPIRQLPELAPVMGSSPGVQHGTVVLESHEGERFKVRGRTELVLELVDHGRLRQATVVVGELLYAPDGLWVRGEHFAPEAIRRFGIQRQEGGMIALGIGVGIGIVAIGALLLAYQGVFSSSHGG